MELSGEVMAVYFAEDIQVGSEFDDSDWPIHITVMPWCVINISKDSLDQEVKKLIAGTEAFSIEVGKPALLGANADIEVNLIYDKTGTLAELHRLLIDSIALVGGSVIDMQFIGDEYTPHMTQTETKALEMGKKLAFNGFYLVLKPSGDTTKRTVISYFKLA